MFQNICSIDTPCSSCVQHIVFFSFVLVILPRRLTTFITSKKTVLIVTACVRLLYVAISHRRFRYVMNSVCLFVCRPSVGTVLPLIQHRKVIKVQIRSQCFLRCSRRRLLTGWLQPAQTPGGIRNRSSNLMYINSVVVQTFIFVYTLIVTWSIFQDYFVFIFVSTNLSNCVFISFKHHNYFVVFRR